MSWVCEGGEEGCERERVCEGGGEGCEGGGEGV